MVCVASGMQKADEPYCSGTIIIYFKTFYHQLKNENISEKKQIPYAYKDEVFNYLSHKKLSAKSAAFKKLKEKIDSANTKVNISTLNEDNYSVNPTCEYIMHIDENNLNQDIQKEIINIESGDTLFVKTSDWDINFSPLYYDWSIDGKWLAISKDDKRNERRSGSSIAIVNLEKKEMEEYKLDEEEYIE